MGGGAVAAEVRRGKAEDLGDAPDDAAYVADLLASEYGWTLREIHELPIDEEARLFHAILYRKGAKPRLANFEIEKPEIGLLERIEMAKQQQIDTDELEKGIVWDSP
jgi:hypothetical protein